jgi:hypothetical protein
MRVAAVLPLLSVLVACSQSDAPSQQMEVAAEELVDTVLETPGATGAASLGRFAPRDECGGLEGARPFLAMLHAAIEARDADVLVALAANDVMLGFGGADGAANLRSSLAEEGSPLWNELDELAMLGCAANGQGGLTLPWAFTRDTGGDAFETMIVTGEEVFLHEAPDGNSARISAFNWDAVEIIEDQRHAAGDAEWTHVRLLPQPGDDREALEGYVRSDMLRSVIDYRLIASSRNGRWRITALLAGD